MGYVLWNSQNAQGGYRRCAEYGLFISMIEVEGSLFRRPVAQIVIFIPQALHADGR